MTLRVLRSAFVACLFCAALGLGATAALIGTSALIVAATLAARR